MEHEVKKTCNNCACLSACKYVQDAKDLFSTNKFYTMFEYAEWNNLEINFKDYAANNCKHYTRTFQDGLIDIETVPYQIMELASKEYLKLMGKEISIWTAGSGRGSKDLVFTLKDKTEVSAVDIAGQVSLKLVKFTN